MMSPALALLSRILTELGIAPLDPDARTPASVPLPSRLATGDLAWAGVAAATIATHGDPLAIDAGHIASAYRSDSILTIDGTAPVVWSASSGFWQTIDGWVRTHGNYPHHARALHSALQVRPDAGADAVADALAGLTTADAVALVTAAGGLAVPVRREDTAADAVRRTTPLVHIERVASEAARAPAPPRHRREAESAPLAGIRVLDLTRVIAGPVCTRTLALWGADVLRLDPPHLPEPEWQHLDTGHGKRSALLDAHSPRMDELLAEADVVVLGYRPAALRRLGLDPAALIARHPGLVIAQLSAWGLDHPDRAGFDSLVQAESGIALIESPDGVRPGALPAQALDHTAGYLLAAAIATLVERRAAEGGSWHAHTSLRRVAAELLGMPRRDEPESGSFIAPDSHRQRFTVDGVDVVTAAPALSGATFATPHPWGTDRPGWSA